MSRQIQIRRGTAAQHSNFTGAIGEVTMDTTNNTLRVHDGVTQGGNEMMSTSKFYSNITNCVVEIPQDIKLELAYGTLTLKAGSKCYLKTDTATPSITIASDLTTMQTTDGTYFAIYDGSALTTVLTTAYDYSTLPSAYSLPLAIVTVLNNAISSIDQVFNGFGFIGSHVFALPGLKCLIPNGLNTDGTLNNIFVSLSSVKTQDVSPVISNNRIIEIFSGGSLGRCQTIETNENNYNIVDGHALSYSVGFCKCYTDANGKISYLVPEKIFRGLNYNDTEYITHQAIPGGYYKDITLPASGGTITAPADGCFLVNKKANNVGEYLNIENLNGTRMAITMCPANTVYTAIYMPVSKGDVVKLNYTMTGSTGYCRFVYANGAK